nr:hypothetical protein [Tanacetum cinerariifolium]
QVYVDDIIFSSTRKEMCTKFEKMMHKNFQMSSMEELTFFLGLQVKQKEDGIFVSQDKIFRYLKGQPKLGLWFPKDSPFDLVAYTDSDYATVVPNSTTEAEYVAALNCYGQVLWIQNELLDYGYNFMQTKIHIDNESTICIATATVKNINREAQLHAKVDGKKVVILEASIRRDLRFIDEGGIDCLTNETIFEQLSLMRFFQVLLNNQLEEMANHTRIYALPSHTKKIFRNIKKAGKGFYVRDTPLFPTMMKPRKTKRQDTKLPQTSVPTETVTNEVINKEMYDILKRAATTATSLDAEQDRGNIKLTHLKIKKDKLKLKELMELCTKLSDRVLNLETTKTAQAKEIANLKKRVKSDEDIFSVNDLDDTLMFDADKDQQGKEVVVEKKVNGKDVSAVEEINAASITTSVTATTSTISMDEIKLAKALIEIKTSRPKAKGIIMQEPKESQEVGKEKELKISWLKRLYKVRLSARVKSSTDEASLGEEDASKQEKISNIDANQDIYLVNAYSDEDIFSVNDLDDTLMFDADKDQQGKEVVVEKKVNGKDVSAVEEINAASITTSVTATTSTISMDEIKLAKALIEIKTSRPKAKGIIMQEPSQTPTPTPTPTPIVSSQQPKKVQDNSKGIMVEPEMPLKKKAQIILMKSLPLSYKLKKITKKGLLEK